MTKENVPDTHKLLEHLDVLVMEYNGKLQVFLFLQKELCAKFIKNH